MRHIVCQTFPKSLSAFLAASLLVLIPALGAPPGARAQNCDEDQFFEFEHEIVVGGRFGGHTQLDVVIQNLTVPTAEVNYTTIPLSATAENGPPNREVDFHLASGGAVLHIGEETTISLSAFATETRLSHRDLEIFARDVAYRDWGEFDHDDVPSEGDLDAFFDDQGLDYPETGYRVHKAFSDAGTLGTGFEAFLLTSEEAFILEVYFDDSATSQCARIEYHRITIHDLDKPPVLAIRGTQELPEDAWTDLHPTAPGYDQFQFNRDEVTDWLDQVAMPLGSDGQPIWELQDYRPSITGHSLGAAVAQWFGSYYSARPNGYLKSIASFNSPGIALRGSAGGGTQVFDETKVETVTHYITAADLVSMAGSEYLDGGRYLFDNGGLPNWQLLSYEADSLSDVYMFKKHGVPHNLERMPGGEAQPGDAEIKTYASVDLIDTAFEESPNVNGTSLADPCFTYLPDKDYLLFQLAVGKFLRSVGQPILARNVGLGLTFRATVEDARQALSSSLYPRNQWYLYLDLSNAFSRLIATRSSIASEKTLVLALATLMTIRPADHLCFEELNEGASGGAGNEGEPSGSARTEGAEGADSEPVAPQAALAPNPRAAEHFWDAILGWNSFILDELEFWQAPETAFETMLFWTDEQWQTFDWAGAVNLTEEEWRQTVPGLQISGRVWNDLDGNGVADDGEAGRGGETLFLDASPFDGNPGAGEPQTTTAVDGSFSFLGIAAGTYRLTQSLDTAQGWELTAPAAGWHEVAGERDPNAVFTDLGFGNLCPQGAPCDDAGGPTSVVTEINDQLFLQSFFDLGRGFTDLDAGIDADAWACGLVGLQSGIGDINETNRGDIIQAYLYRQGGSWRIRVDVRTHGFFGHERWPRVDVLCVDAAMSSYGGPQPGRLFFLQEYESLGDDIRYDTGVSAADWDCAVVGFAALDGDINASGTSHIMYAYPYIDSGSWHLRGEFRTRTGRHEDWKMNMLCADSRLVGRGSPQAGKPMFTTKLVDPPHFNPVDTGIPTADWVCGIGGMKIYDGDIDEWEPINQNQPLIEAYLFEGAANWMAELSFKTHNESENWDVDLLCHRRGIPTQIGQVPSVPRNLMATPGDGSVTLDWNPPNSDGGYPVEHYEYEVRQPNSALRSGSTATTSASRSDLVNGYTYSAKVRAVNAVGAGPWSPEVSFTPVAAGQVTVTPYFSPGYLVGLSASWTPVPGAAEYRVTHFRQDDCGSATVTITTTDLVSSSGLHENCGAPGDCYFKEATVKAIGSAGQILSTDSASICEMGQPPLPGVPQNLSAVPGNDQISLSWDPPAGSVVDSYDYSIREIDEIPGPQWSTTSTSVTRTGLLNGVRHFAKVRAVNEAGAGDWTAELEVTPNPPPPFIVSADPYFSPGYYVGLSASWGAYPGAVEYRVTHFRQDDCDSVSVTVTTTALSSGSGLHENCGAPSSCYFKEATVEALSGSGAVLATDSASLCEVGEPDVDPPSVPRNLIATGGDGSISLDWDPPADDGGAPITSYVYSIRPYGSSGQSWSTSATAVTRSGFANGTLYYAKVKARNDAGDSVWTAEVPVTPQAPPSFEVAADPYFSPDYYVGLSATWDSYPGAVEYRITHYRQNDCGSASVTVTTTGLSSGSGLHYNCGAPSSCYFKEATVEALSSTGAVLATDTASICEVGEPDVDPPSVPRNLTATGGDGSISLNWDPPADDGGEPVTSYVYSIRPYNNSGSSWSTGATAVTRTGFANGTLYYAKVKARNDVGDSPWTAEVQVTPEAPVTLQVTATPYYAPGYEVGLSASWNAYPGAVEYRVTHYRQNDCGSATTSVTTSGLSSGSGRHFNCGAPDSCYFRQATVEALSSSGAVLATDTASICEVGYP